MLEWAIEKRCKSDFKTNGKKIDPVRYSEVFLCLVTEQPLPKKYNDHALTGDKQGFRECHLDDEILLVYRYSYDDEGNRDKVLLEAIVNHKKLKKRKM